MSSDAVSFVSSQAQGLQDVQCSVTVCAGDQNMIVKGPRDHVCADAVVGQFLGQGSRQTDGVKR